MFEKQILRLQADHARVENESRSAGPSLEFEEWKLIMIKMRIPKIAS